MDTLQQSPQVDTWIWGQELILWGYHPSHQYTLKGLSPKRGRQGCLSLQYHNKKSESWVCVRGSAWALLVVDGQVCTRVLEVGDVQNIETGMIHRLMGVSENCLVLEPSTPDAHAADKDQPKDVVRLHCVLGRECAKPRDAHEAAVIQVCIERTEEAIGQIEAGQTPTGHNGDLLRNISAFHLPL